MNAVWDPVGWSKGGWYYVNLTFFIFTSCYTVTPSSKTEAIFKLLLCLTYSIFFDACRLFGWIMHLATKRKCSGIIREAQQVWSVGLQILKVLVVVNICGTCKNNRPVKGYLYYASSCQVMPNQCVAHLIFAALLVSGFSNSNHREPLSFNFYMHQCLVSGPCRT